MIQWQNRLDWRLSLLDESILIRGSLYAYTAGGFR